MTESIEPREHVNDDQLRLLLNSEEGSSEYLTVSGHVESCERCCRRLSDLAGHHEFDLEAISALNEYPWDELRKARMGRVDLRPSESVETNVHQGEISRPGAPGPSLKFLSAPSHPEMMGRIGRYEIEKIIGSGGMGIVLKAFDTELNRPVAIKVLTPHLAHCGAARKRFAREARAAAAVVHDHVVSIHNVDIESDVPFLVMEYVLGESLQDRVDREGALKIDEVLRIGIQAAAGLTAAHQQGVVHRDIKPANILLSNGLERALLSDFGLARTVDDASLTRSGFVAGTPHYMSPEQANGEATDCRTDLFSLGAVLYFMATGQPPFRAEKVMGVLHRICHDRQRPLWQVNPDVPDEFSILVDRLLEKQPGKRIRTAHEVQHLLTRMLAARQEPYVGLHRKLRRIVLRLPRSARFWAAAVIVFAVLTGGIGISRLQPVSGRREPVHPTKLSPTAAVLDSIDQQAFDALADELNSRLDGLYDRGEATAPLDDEWDHEITSLQQRLEKLQRTSHDPTHLQGEPE